VDDLIASARAVLPDVRRDLEDLVRIESVWADPDRRDEVQRSAQKVSDLLHDAGFADVQAVRDIKSFALTVAKLHRGGAGVLFNFYSGQDFKDATQVIGQIHSISVTGETASAVLDERAYLGADFTNRFGLVRIDGTWRIVSKVFTTL